jgi:hypothetical protein
VDKSLTKEDVERMHREADLNGDGVLSANELMNTYVQRALQIKEDRLALSFQLLDRNGDGKISEAELRVREECECCAAPRALLTALALCAGRDRAVRRRAFGQGRGRLAQDHLRGRQGRRRPHRL